MPDEGPGDGAAPLGALVEVVRVEPARAIRCERPGCGRRVYAAIHFVLFEDGRLEAWGRDCFAEHLEGRVHAPTLPSFPDDLPADVRAEILSMPGVTDEFERLRSGRPRDVTPHELELLQSNRQALLAWIMRHRQELIETARREIEERRAEELRRRRAAEEWRRRTEEELRRRADEERKRIAAEAQLARNAQGRTGPIARIHPDAAKTRSEPPPPARNIPRSAPPDKWTPTPIPARREGWRAPQLPRKPVEPLDDPDYLAIRTQLEEESRSWGRDPTVSPDRERIIASALHRYHRIHGSR